MTPFMKAMTKIFSALVDQIQTKGCILHFSDGPDWAKLMNDGVQINGSSL